MSDTKASDAHGPSASSSSTKPAESQTKTKTQHTQPSPQTSSAWPGLGANFAHDPKAPFTVNYDQEVYLQFMAGEEGTGTTGTGTGTGTGTPDISKKNKNKTPKQIYREEWVRRALNPAISDPRGEPSPSDFEYAESQRIRERF
ncbi:uncharacterized protein DSM5745_01528 [Aspergillus mulundensis]|uniref:Uncharacterized protein n=1 Tax=Aspergillus mulundensis TaxID=1810919 RepID=A0A3D8T6L8_9EURO|nr:hypothetical protein DSM5745_01528 [Aspergillus mulundensis]RDW94206.1 hypothetical protein DSM5745_01528 [Aspergillus mulundensis]